MAIVLGFCLLLLVCSMWRIMTLKRELQRLELLLNQDELTGVRSRRSLMMQSRMASQLTADTNHAQFVFIDMNDLKSINTLGGHAAGDLALRELGQRLNQFCHQHEWVARYGGDEFVLMLLSTPEEVERRMEALLNSLDQPHRFTWAQGKILPDLDWLEQINCLSRQVVLQKLKSHKSTDH